MKICPSGGDSFVASNARFVGDAPDTWSRIGSSCPTLRLMGRVGAVVFTACLLIACDLGSSDAELSPEASSYLTAALDTIEAYHIDRKEVEWPSFRQAVRKRAQDAESPADTYGAIRFALNRLDDHSSFEPPADAPSQKRDGSPPPGALSLVLANVPASARTTDVLGVRLGSSVGYVHLPAFSGGEQAATTFANEIQTTLQRVDSTTVCGWIVDLRENSGGNMWPMLAGIGPVVGEGHLGSFVYPDSDTLKWFYEDGASVYGDQTVISVSGSPYEPHAASPPVAVLLGRQTASAGEAVAVAFQGRPRTRTFGHPTWGLTTAIAVFPLRDGAELNLAVAPFVDRTGTRYRGPIVPDVRGNNPPSGEPTLNDDIVRTAERWIERHPGCSAH